MYTGPGGSWKEGAQLGEGCLRKPGLSEDHGASFDEGGAIDGVSVRDGLREPIGFQPGLFSLPDPCQCQPSGGVHSPVVWQLMERRVQLCQSARERLSRIIPLSTQLVSPGSIQESRLISHLGLEGHRPGRAEGSEKRIRLALPECQAGSPKAFAALWTKVIGPVLQDTP
jgi:hypothetical protein